VTGRFCEPKEMRQDAPLNRAEFPLHQSFLAALTHTYLPKQPNRGRFKSREFEPGGEYAAHEPDNLARAVMIELFYAAQIRGSRQTVFTTSYFELIKRLQGQGVNVIEHTARPVTLADLNSALRLAKWSEFNFYPNWDHDSTLETTELPEWRSKMFDELWIDSAALTFRFDPRVIKAWCHAPFVLSADLDAIAHIRQRHALMLYIWVECHRVMKGMTTVQEFSLSDMEEMLDPGKDRRKKANGRGNEEKDEKSRRVHFDRRFMGPAVRELQHARPWGDKIIRLEKIRDRGVGVTHYRFFLLSDPEMIAHKIGNTASSEYRTHTAG
jgi:hypothetical protein